MGVKWKWLACWYKVGQRQWNINEQYTCDRNSWPPRTLNCGFVQIIKKKNITADALTCSDGPEITAQVPPINVWMVDGFITIFKDSVFILPSERDYHCGLHHGRCVSVNVVEMLQVGNEVLQRQFGTCSNTNQRRLSKRNHSNGPH